MYVSIAYAAGNFLISIYFNFNWLYFLITEVIFISNQVFC